MRGGCRGRDAQASEGEGRAGRAWRRSGRPQARVRRSCAGQPSRSRCPSIHRPAASGHSVRPSGISNPEHPRRSRRRRYAVSPPGRRCRERPVLLRLAVDLKPGAIPGLVAKRRNLRQPAGDRGASEAASACKSVHGSSASSARWAALRAFRCLSGGSDFSGRGGAPQAEPSAGSRIPYVVSTPRLAVGQHPASSAPRLPRPPDRPCPPAHGILRLAVADDQGCPDRLSRQSSRPRGRRKRNRPSVA